MKNDIALVESEQLKKDIPDFKPGDTVTVYVKIVEADNKVRLQAFEGIVICKKGRGISATFTVRRISYGEGVERVFPLHSPFIDRIEVVKRGKVKRAKLYYLRRKLTMKVEEEKSTKADSKEQQTARDDKLKDIEH